MIRRVVLLLYALFIILIFRIFTATFSPPWAPAKAEVDKNEPPKQGANMIQNPEKYLITAGGKICCRRCKAQSSRTKLQCAKPALKGKVVCQFHGGLSTGPKTKEGKQRIQAAHLKHGNETLEAKAERNEKNVMFKYLLDLGNHVGLFYTQLKIQGRPPPGYVRLNLTDPEQLALAILKTLPKQ